MDFADYGQLIEWNEEKLQFYSMHGDPDQYLNEISLKKVFKDITIGLQYCEFFLILI